MTPHEPPIRVDPTTGEDHSVVPAKKRLSRPFTIAYSLLLGAFLAVEMIAVWRAEPGDTFSEHVWSLLDGPVSYTVIGGFLVWLLVHFLTKGKV